MIYSSIYHVHLMHIVAEQVNTDGQNYFSMSALIPREVATADLLFLKWWVSAVTILFSSV